MMEVQVDAPAANLICTVTRIAAAMIKSNAIASVAA
jgi:hypothetical protein